MTHLTFWLCGEARYKRHVYNQAHICKKQNMKYYLPHTLHLNIKCEFMCALMNKCWKRHTCHLWNTIAIYSYLLKHKVGFYTKNRSFVYMCVKYVIKLMGLMTDEAM